MAESIEVAPCGMVSSSKQPRRQKKKKKKRKQPETRAKPSEALLSTSDDQVLP